MPTYDYRCEKGHVFELHHSIKDETPKFCPKCGKVSKRVPSGGAGLLFKGSGFYITDYRSKSYKDGAKAEKGSPAKPSPGSSSGSSSGGASGSSPGPGGD